MAKLHLHMPISIFPLNNYSQDSNDIGHLLQFSGKFCVGLYKSSMNLSFKMSFSFKQTAVKMLFLSSIHTLSHQCTAANSTSGSANNKHQRGADVYEGCKIAKNA